MKVGIVKIADGLVIPHSTEFISKLEVVASIIRYDISKRTTKNLLTELLTNHLI